MTNLNIELARHNMVEQQIRPWEVLDQRVLDLVAQAPREDYVPDIYRNLAFVDFEIPLGFGEVMMPPKLEARLLQELELVSTDTVLEIGTGSGYFTSLLATLGKHVTSIEIEPTFSHRAAKKLSAHNVRNVTLEVGDGARGWDKGAPFNVIVLTGSVPVLSDRFVKSLKEGGRLIAIVGQAPAMQACFTRRLKGENLEMRSLFETVVPPLKNAPAHSAFEF